MNRLRNIAIRAFASFILLTISGSLTGLIFSGFTKHYDLVSSRDIIYPEHNSTFGGTPEAQNLDELVEQSNVIVVGKIGPVINEGSFFGYDGSGGLITSLPQTSNDEPPLLAAKFVDYEVKIQQVLKDDGSLNTGKKLVLRIPDIGSDADDPEQEIVVSDPNPNRPKLKSSRRPVADFQRRIFILKQNPDKQTYGPYFFSQGLLMIDGLKVTKSNGKRSGIKFGNSDPNGFIQELKQVIEKKPK
jgi:hypothetical protein